MRSKAPLVLIEQIIMLLVFSIAAAICVRAFVYADQLSLEKELRDQAIIKAQTVAETYKYYSGNAENALNDIGGIIENNKWITYWDGRWNICDDSQSQYKIVVTNEKNNVKGLGTAELKVFSIDGKQIIILPVAWQEEF